MRSLKNSLEKTNRKTLLKKKEHLQFKKIVYDRLEHAQLKKKADFIKKYFKKD